MLIAIVKWIMLALALILVSSITPGIEIAGLIAALISVVVISLVNTFIKPIIVFLTLPINIVTLGLFLLVINALMLGFAAFLVPGFTIEGFFPALFGSIFYSILSLIINLAVKQSE